MPGARLNIALRPSRRHWQLLLGSHLLLLVAVVVLQVPIIGKALLTLALLINIAYTRRLLHRLREISQLSLEHEQLSAFRLGQWQVVECLTPLLVSSWVTIIKLRINGGNYVLPLWRDSADAEAVRQLRVWLLCGGWKRHHENTRT